MFNTWQNPVFRRLGRLASLSNYRAQYSHSVTAEVNNLSLSLPLPLSLSLSLSLLLSPSLSHPFFQVLDLFVQLSYLPPLHIARHRHQLSSMQVNALYIMMDNKRGCINPLPTTPKNLLTLLKLLLTLTERARLTLYQPLFIYFIPVPIVLIYTNCKINLLLTLSAMKLKRSDKEN